MRTSTICLWLVVVLCAIALTPASGRYVKKCHTWSPNRFISKTVCRKVWVRNRRSSFQHFEKCEKKMFGHNGLYNVCSKCVKFIVNNAWTTRCTIYKYTKARKRRSAGCTYGNHAGRPVKYCNGKREYIDRYSYNCTKHKVPGRIAYYSKCYRCHNYVSRGQLKSNCTRVR